jgi:hypothetical protein
MDSEAEEQLELGKSNSLRRKFTPDEDRELRALVERLGTKSWEEIAHSVPGRSARQCRNRYKNYLLDSLVTNPWTPEEDAMLIKKFHQIGPKWVEIGKVLSGRSGNNVKNRWYKHLCKMDIGAPPPGPDVAALPAGQSDEKSAVNLGHVIGWSDSDWARLFAAEESAVMSPSEWSPIGGSGEPLL